MAAHYHLPGFLRQLSRDLLTRLIEHHIVDLGIDLKATKQRAVEPISDAINRLPDDQRQRLDPTFRNIQALASEAGLKHIVDEARHSGVEIIPNLQLQKSFLDKVAWAYLTHPSLFEAASRLAVRDTLPGRYWKRRLPIAPFPEADLSGAAKPLEAAISDYFTREEGRGKACQVDYVKRDALHHFFAYPEDFPAAPLAWTTQGLGTHSFRPAFEVIFVFDAKLGCLDIYCEGDPQAIKKLRAVFAKAVLGIGELPEATKPAYTLDGLTSGGFPFIRSPGSPVAEVRIKRLGFRVLGRPTKITVETDPSQNPRAIEPELARIFTTGSPELSRYSLAQTRVVSATLVATIDPQDGSRPRTRTFDVTTKSCALKYEGSDLLLRHVLADSGIDIASAGLAHDAQPSRPAA